MKVLLLGVVILGALLVAASKTDFVHVYKDYSEKPEEKVDIDWEKFFPEYKEDKDWLLEYDEWQKKHNFQDPFSHIITIDVSGQETVKTTLATLIWVRRGRGAARGRGVSR